MKLKKGDSVLVIAGKDKGRKGKIIKSFPREEKIVVEGVNTIVKHSKPKREGQKGEKVHIPAPIHVSNAKLICPHCGKATRVGYSIIDSKKVRICKKCGEVI